MSDLSSRNPISPLEKLDIFVLPNIYLPTKDIDFIEVPISQPPRVPNDSIAPNIISMDLMKPTVVSRSPEQIQAHAIDQFHRALTLIKNPLTESDLHKGIACLEESAAHDYPPALYELGLYYYHGQYNIIADKKKAIELLKKAADQGLEIAKGTLEKLEPQRKDPHADLITLSNQNDANAQYKLGYFYSRGLGVDQNYKKAFECFTKAAQQNHAKAIFCLGSLYHKGLYARKDIRKASRLYKKSAFLGYAEAEYNCGLIYKKGTSIKRNYKKAFEYFTKAADKNFIPAQYSLALCYEEGLGCEIHLPLAFSYYELAAKANHRGAQFNMGLCYMQGKGTQVNYQVALEWFKKAADQKHVQAQTAQEELEKYLKKQTNPRKSAHIKKKMRPTSSSASNSPPHGILKRQKQDNQSAPKRVRFSDPE